MTTTKAVATTGFPSKHLHGDSRDLIMILCVTAIGAILDGWNGAGLGLLASTLCMGLLQAASSNRRTR